MRSQKDYLILNDTTTEATFKEWLAQNYTCENLGICFDESHSLNKGVIGLHINNVQEIAQKYQDEPIYIDQINNLKLLHGEIKMGISNRNQINARIYDRNGGNYDYISKNKTIRSKIC